MTTQSARWAETSAELRERLSRFEAAAKLARSDLQALDDEIEEIRAELEKAGRRETVPNWAEGDAVEVVGGPYDGCRGVLTWQDALGSYVQLDGYASDYRFDAAQLAPVEE